MDIELLTEEQKEKLAEAKTVGELFKVLEDEGIELIEEELALIAGGGGRPLDTASIEMLRQAGVRPELLACFAR